jgi:hypothetical protein
LACKAQKGRTATPEPRERKEIPGFKVLRVIPEPQALKVTPGQPEHKETPEPRAIRGLLEPRGTPAPKVTQGRKAPKATPELLALKVILVLPGFRVTQEPESREIPGRLEPKVIPEPKAHRVIPAQPVSKVTPGLRAILGHKGQRVLMASLEGILLRTLLTLQLLWPIRVNRIFGLIVQRLLLLQNSRLVMRILTALT